MLPRWGLRKPACKMNRSIAVESNSGKEPRALVDPWMDFREFSIARWAHWDMLLPKASELYGRSVDPATCDLKSYQDLLVFAFIRDNLPPGSRLLEIGGGNSRVLAKLASTYECWNVDKFEGVGNGPLQATDASYFIVKDYMGNFNPALADAYFDFVFSISALEHVDGDATKFDALLEDMDRVLVPGGLSLHCLDILCRPETIVYHRLLDKIHETRSILHPWVPTEELLNDTGIYHMSKQAYDAGWRAIIGESYEVYGKPSSSNVLWRKPLTVGAGS